MLPNGGRWLTGNTAWQKTSFNLMKTKIVYFSLIFLLGSVRGLFSQTAYFADGQHGGIWGHYPLYVTQYLVDQLNKHPDWKINLEIEPETWDVVQSNTPDAYHAFKALFEDQSAKGRIAYVNPEYGQSYLWNVTGESVIRQFDYGIRKVREHFPNAEFTAYASEEPCFTSALPGILKSFGFQYAVLKNPNTCWGGYTRAFGGELVDWIGPDGTKIITVPRYSIESLLEGSTWQTIAWNGSDNYINAALAADIKHPIGMCFQDAGWRNGPWLGDRKGASHPTVYETWRNYFENVANKSPTQDWQFSQEDVLVSLMWGSQVLQRIAQEVRSAENEIVTAEKLAAMAKLFVATPWPESTLKEAWRTLLLSEHHDCWIVPYNSKDGSTWASHIAAWTDGTKQRSETLIQKSTAVLSQNPEEGQGYVRIFNTLGTERRAVASVALPANWGDAAARILDSKKIELPSQIVSQSESNAKEILFPADVPSMGYNTWQLEKRLEKAPRPASIGASASLQADGNCTLETDLYRIILDPSKGGVIKSLLAKDLNNKEFVDVTNARSFDEIRGYFYNDGGFHSSADNPAKVTILENGPIRVKVAIEGMISSHPFVELITVTQGQKRIDFHLKIDWKGNPGIGSEYCQAAAWRQTDNRKAFYDDQYKLLALFPLSFPAQKVYKNAPFDVTESKLTNTFFTTWDGIKNDIILNWVDVVDASNNHGLALLTDHTTSYAHGTDFPLSLTLQYSGMGLWGRNYRITGPLDVNYAIIPHAGAWDHAGMWTESDSWNQPLVAAIMRASPDFSDYRKSLIDVTGTGLEVPALMFQGNDLIVRIFNAEGNAASKEIIYNGNARKVQLVELNGEVAGDLEMQKNRTGGNIVTVTLPRFGIRTIRFCDAGI